MMSDKIITFLPILVGVFCFTVFCIYRRRLNRMNPSQRQGKKAKMEAWLTPDLGDPLSSPSAPANLSP